jgi:hypothetical protein
MLYSWYPVTTKSNIPGGRCGGAERRRLRSTAFVGGTMSALEAGAEKRVLPLPWGRFLSSFGAADLGTYGEQFGDFHSNQTIVGAAFGCAPVRTVDVFR